MQKNGTWFCLSQVMEPIRKKNPNFPEFSERKNFDFEYWGNPKKLCALIEFRDGRIASVRVIFNKAQKIRAIRAVIASNKKLLVRHILRRTRSREQEFASKRSPICRLPAT